MNNKALRTDWSSRKNKRDNDAVINIRIKPLLNSKEEISMVTLPGPKFIFEEQLIKNNPDNKFVILGVERDEYNNKLANEKSIELMRKYRNCEVAVAPPGLDFRSIISRQYNCSTPAFSNEVVWDVIYADYMGTWNPQSLEDIEIIFNSKNNVLNKLGIFISTYMLARGAGGESGLWGKTKTLGEVHGAPIQIDDDRIYERLHSHKPLSAHVHKLARGIAVYTKKIALSMGSDLHIYAPHVYYSPSAPGREYPEGSFCYYKK